MTPDAIDAAAARIAGHVRKTPILFSPFLDEIAGRRVWVKAECLQITGSFKARGAFSAVSALTEAERSKGVLAYSSGNHAQGIAWAATAHGIPSVVVMPADAPQLKIDNTRALGAEVALYDRPGGESREEVGGRIAEERGMAVIPPYDHPEVIAGQGTVGREIAAEMGDLEANLLVCCGGGGLSSGVAAGVEGTGLRVRTVEPEGFDDVARSLVSGEIVANDRVSGSICDAILTPSPGRLTFPILKRLAGPGLVVTDEEALHAMALAALRLKLALEPGGAVALAAALFHPGEIEGDAVICVASGGNADPAMLARAMATL